MRKSNKVPHLVTISPQRKNDYVLLLVAADSVWMGLTGALSAGNHQ
jgi:hypothetical protein